MKINIPALGAQKGFSAIASDDVTFTCTKSKPEYDFFQGPNLMLLTLNVPSQHLESADPKNVELHYLSTNRLTAKQELALKTAYLKKLDIDAEADEDGDEAGLEEGSKLRIPGAKPKLPRAFQFGGTIEATTGLDPLRRETTSFRIDQAASSRIKTLTVFHPGFPGKDYDISTWNIVYNHGTGVKGFDPKIEKAFIAEFIKLAKARKLKQGSRFEIVPADALGK